MEIIHVILGKANPDRMNGVNKVVHQLATRQVSAGYHVRVWGITNNPVHDYPERDYKTELFAAAKIPFTVGNDFKKAIHQLPKGVVFHLHGGFIPVMYAIAGLLGSISIPYIFTPHGSYNTIAMQKSAFRKKLYFRFFEKSLLKSASSIHNLGQSEIEGLNEIFPNNKSVLIPYGFERIDPCAGVIKNSQFIIGFCGRIDIYTKGLAELLRGFAKFNQSYADSQLWIIGDGNERITLEHLAQSLNIAQSVIFHGSKYGQDKIALLQQLDVFAAPSRNEGMPTAVLEASALGIPCLVTTATNTGEIIKKYDAGEVLHHTDENEIADGIIKLYKRIVSDREADQLKSNALKMIDAEFNWALIVEKLYQVYRAA
jgi:glycosyltransferase involved in cell wall biosynthesis